MGRKKKHGQKSHFKPRQLMSKVTTSSSSTPNPFDVHFNKIKKNVLGRKVLKCEVGRPTKSRHDAVNKRKKTLMQEYLSKDKAGKVTDRRIKDGQGGGLAKRKAKIFELKMREAEETTLTHGGEFLDEDNLLNEKPADDADFDEDNDLNLLKRPDYIDSVHFGGPSTENSDANVRKKTKEEFMDEVMGEKRKRQYEHEMNAILTEKLDDEWRDVRALMNVSQEMGRKSQRKMESIEFLLGKDRSEDKVVVPQEQQQQSQNHPTKPKDNNNDDDDDSKVNKGYDLLMKELIFAAKVNKAKAKGNEGQDVISSSTGPQDRIRKSREEKKAQQEREKLEDEEKRQKVIERIRQNNVVILPLIEPRLTELTTKIDPHKKLKVKVKRELKGAQRELRKDTAFLKDVWLKEMKEKDEDRKRKLNKILADIASDVHDVRKCKKSAEV